MVRLAIALSLEHPQHFQVWWTSVVIFLFPLGWDWSFSYSALSSVPGLNNIYSSFVCSFQNAYFVNKTYAGNDFYCTFIHLPRSSGSRRASSCSEGLRLCFCWRTPRPGGPCLSQLASSPWKPKAHDLRLIFRASHLFLTSNLPVLLSSWSEALRSPL